MPGRSPEAVRGVFVQPGRAIDWQRLTAKVEESVRYVVVAASVQYGRNDGAIPRPNIGVVRPGSLHDIGVVRCNDRAALVNICTNSEQAAAKQFGNRFGKTSSKVRG